MTAKSQLCRPARWIVFFALSLCTLVSSRPLSGEESPNAKNKGKAPFHIEVQDGQGARIAGPESAAASSKKSAAVLIVDREYQPGDRIVLGGPQRMAARLDENMPECVIYLASSPAISFYEIPYGTEEKQTGSAFAPESFAGKSHRITVRALDKPELKDYRNLALNPCDVRETEGDPVHLFPHASTNSVSRSLFDFGARNAIDGATKNGHHGVWPYQSWGPQLRTDLWWKLDFGRPVELDKVRLMVRADFPHDSYWKTAKIEFSNGSHVDLQIGSSAEFQDFPFKKRRVSWLRITDLVPVDPARWCSFIEVEAWGRDRP
jgi:hypothetical protein